MPKKATRKKVEAVKNQQELGARRALLEELFNDWYIERKKVYLVNFIRGLFFGLGSVLGGTILLALAVWILSQLGSVVPFLSDFIQDIIQTINSGD